MAAFNSQSPFSPHSDILSAQPSDNPSRISLINEVKSRARVSISCQNYPEAEVLYTKGIEIATLEAFSDKCIAAILYSNRSMARYQMGKLSDSVDDAEMAVENDPSYLKAYWRLGQALYKLKQYADAKQAYENGISKLGPKDGEKPWKKEVEKCINDMKNTGNDTTSTSATKTVKKNKPKASSSSEKSHVVVDDEKDDSLFTKSDAVRGYQVVNGKKTSFFHHEQTEEQKRLIGDIAPKRLDTSDTITNATTPSESSKEKGSVWNKAGTWEEKNITASAKKELSNLLKSISETVPNATVMITRVKSIEGHASLVTVKTKRKFLFEFEFELEFEVEFADEEQDGSGVIKFVDVDADSEEYEMVKFVVEDCGKDEDNLKKAIKGVLNDGVGKAVKLLKDAFVQKL